MSVKIYKKNNAGRRKMTVLKPANLDKKKPQKSLLMSYKSKAGRSRGKISIRHRGGGAKRKYRKIDFKMNKFGVPGQVAAIEKDPIRNALIALVNYQDGEKRYVLATQNLEKGTKIITQEKAPIKEGNRGKLKNFPVGTIVCNIEMVPGKGGQLARSAGTSAVLQAVEKDFVQLKIASGEIRLVKADCYATIGQVSNFEHNTVKIGKAGRKRHLGWRPVVRGSAMNPVDHPHGGGEGRQPIGLKHPKTPWGKPALGKKTRKRNKKSSRFILKRRKK